MSARLVLPLTQHPSEPFLTRADAEMWLTWRRTCALHAKTRLHRSRVDAARRAVESMERTHPGAYLSWSAGKDSTALAALLASMGLAEGRLAMSLKDDLDFPREEAYLRALSRRWGFDLRLITPETSIIPWLLERRINVTRDLHTRASEYAKEVFWRPLEAWEHEHGARGAYIGLRAQESNGRAANARYRGFKYTKRDGATTCQPLAFWQAEDVFAFLFEQGVEPFEVYRCCRLKKSPAWIRLDGMLPGIYHTEGSNLWFKTHYPYLHNKLCDLFPELNNFC